MSRVRTLKVVAASALIALSGIAPTAGLAQSRSVIAAGEQPRMINLPRGTSFAVDLPADARDVIVSNPQVAEAMLHSPRRITVIGLAPGETDAVFLDGAGRTILALRVRVDAGVSALQDTLGRVAPGSDIRAEAVNDTIILTGTALSPADAERAQQVARAFVSAPEKVLNMIGVAGSDQVTLRVRVVEVQRTAIKQLGFDTNAVLGRIGEAQGIFGQAATFGVNGGLLGGFTGGYFNDSTQQPQMLVPCSGGLDPDAECFQIIRGPNDPGGIANWDTAQPRSTVGDDGLNKGEATIKAFERAGLIRTLAEPNLTSVNGEAASFLAGGEFPIVVGRDDRGTILTEYKPYGVNLSFRPVVMSGGRISLQISVEVSELTNSGAVTIGAGTPNAISLAGLNVRRVTNTVELPSGGSMMIAGLLQESTRQNIDSFPGLMTVPVLGTLFRSRDYQSGETELVVLVEPYIVSPTSPGRMQTPADGLRIASDAQTILFGQLNQAYGSPAPTAQGTGWQGPVGYVIE
ncbi:MAG: type II and III secretion system protein family protein [Brevundimonas sp.]|uniref:type II and III secretion system protein family protein n=1 Tax=Brevundimonas sp. TaxID=1871086 RepID=UPI0025BDEBA0|nr:type II and III secretion system protein family protein [Brevundimonas sp.]MBX3478720.1 type II and III secretion system protein family protein [Brevundimonas sp.]